MIKSELRLIEREVVKVVNSNFDKGGDVGWSGTGTTTWQESDYTNSMRKMTGTTSKLSQELDVCGTTISTTYFAGSKPYKVEYSIFGDNDPTSTFTPYFGGVAGTTRNQNGTYYDIFYVAKYDPSYIMINDTDALMINDTDIFLWE